LIYHAESDKGLGEFIAWKNSSDQRIKELSFFIERMNLDDKLGKIEPLTLQLCELDRHIQQVDAFTDNLKLDMKKSMETTDTNVKNRFVLLED